MLLPQKARERDRRYYVFSTLNKVIQGFSLTLDSCWMARLRGQKCVVHNGLQAINIKCTAEVPESSRIHSSRTTCAS